PAAVRLRRYTLSLWSASIVSVPFTNSPVPLQNRITTPGSMNSSPPGSTETLKQTPQGLLARSRIVRPAPMFPTGSHVRTWRSRTSKLVVFVTGGSPRYVPFTWNGCPARSIVHVLHACASWGDTGWGLGSVDEDARVQSG